MEIQQIMEKNFKNVIVKGEEYPLNFIRKILSYVVTITQISVFTTMILGESIKPFLINFIPNYLIDWVCTNKPCNGAMLLVAERTTSSPSLSRT